MKKGKNKPVPVHAIIVYGGIGEWRYSSSHPSLRKQLEVRVQLYLWGYPLNARLGRPQSRSERFGEQKILSTSSGLLCSVSWLNTDVSGQPIGPIIKGQVSFFLDTWPLKMGPIGYPESSVLNQLYAAQ